ncbi:MAG: hypothetical protein KDM91_22805, partial [Verrucomicrobiae bacterium]|nr:hypothetical protein [Verrucomicrobiae bacterium]
MAIAAVATAVNDGRRGTEAARIARGVAETDESAVAAISAGCGRRAVGSVAAGVVDHAKADRVSAAEVIHHDVAAIPTIGI